MTDKKLTDAEIVIEDLKNCKRCEYQELGTPTCEMALLADYLMQNGFFRQCKRSDEV